MPLYPLVTALLTTGASVGGTLSKDHSIEAVVHTAFPGVIIWLLTVTGGSLVTRKGFDINVDILREDSKE